MLIWGAICKRSGALTGMDQLLFLEGWGGVDYWRLLGNTERLLEITRTQKRLLNVAQEITRES